MIGLACLALLIAGWGLLPRSPAGRLSGVVREPGAARRGPGSDWLGWLLAGCGLLAGVGWLRPNWLLVAVPGVVGAGTLGWLVARGRAERARHAAADEVVQACLGLAAQLRVGDIPARALARVAVDSPLLAPVAATQAIGGDVPAALRAVAVRPGCGGLAALARSWQLCQLTGAPVAAAANRVAEALRLDAAAERLVNAELAGPRASGRMMAALPLLGLGLGFVGGGDPLAFLAGTLLGRACLAGAICLVCAGLVWTTLLGRVPDLEEQT